MDALEPAYWWLIAAALFFAIEAFGVPGLGFLFAGIAALITGILIEYGPLDADNVIEQGAAFLGLTALFAALLWKRIKAWRTNPSADSSFSNMVGDEAVILEGGLEKGKRGKAKWSGTAMSAELSSDADIDSLDAETIVEIVAVKGNCLIVAPRS